MAPASAPQRVEVRRPVVAGDHRLAVDQERLRLETGCANSITSNALSACVDACGLPDAALSKGFPRTFSDTQQKIARVHESQDGSRFC
jgi:hypothetical protein